MPIPISDSNLGSISCLFRDTATYSLTFVIEKCGQTVADRHDYY